MVNSDTFQVFADDTWVCSFVYTNHKNFIHNIYKGNKVLNLQLKRCRIHKFKIWVIISDLNHAEEGKGGGEYVP